jgi:serine/threonine protein kinase
MVNFSLIKKIFRYGTASDFPNISKELELGPVLGKGSFAMVYKAIDLMQNKQVAVKVYEKKNLLHREKKQFVQTEIDVMGQIDHPHISKFYRVLEDNKAVFLVQERCGDRSLSEYVKRSKGRRLEELEARVIFKQFIGALRYLHQKNICHRDLKLTNILIEKSTSKCIDDMSLVYKVKLIDFGFAIVSTRKYRTYCGTPSYMAPELVNRVSYDGIKVDIWAVGVILYKLVTGEYPFGSEKDKNLDAKIKAVTIEFPEYVSAECRDLILKCLKADPNERISARSIESHSWVVYDKKFPKYGDSEQTCQETSKSDPVPKPKNPSIIADNNE